MMRKPPRRVGFCLSVASIAVLAAAAWAAPGKPLADIVPRQTMAVIDGPPLKALWEDFQKNLAPGFVDDDLKKAWAKLWEGKWERELRDAFGVQPLDFLLTYPQRIGIVLGDIAPLMEAAATDKKPTPEALQAALCLDAGTGKEEFAKAFEKFLDSGVEYARKKGTQLAVRRENYHNAPYFIICENPPTESAKDEKAGKTPLNVYVGWIDTWLVATVSKSYLEKMLDVREGAPALNANESYRAARETLQWKSDESTLYVDVRPLFEALKTAVAKQAGTAQDKESKLAIDVIELLFGEVTTLAGKAGYVDRAVASEYFIACDQGTQPGVLHLLGRKDGLSFPAWAWADDNAMQFATAMDAKFLQAFVPKLLTMIYKTQFDESMAEAWRTQFSAFFMGVDLEKDILGSIGERLTVVIKTKEPAPKPAAAPKTVGPEDDDDVELSADMTMSEFLIALELQKAEPWQTLLGQLNTMTRGSLDQTEYMGRKFFTFADMPSIKLMGGIADGMLLFGSRDMLEQAVRRFGKDVAGLTEDAGFKELAGGVGKPNAFLAHAAQASFGIDELRDLWAMGESELADEVKKLNDPVAKELADSCLELVREVLKEKHWKDLKPRSIGTAAWEDRGLRFRSVERWTSTKATEKF